MLSLTPFCFQALVQRYRVGTPEQFWDTFRESNGKNMSLTKIGECLRLERQAADAALATRAHEEYGTSFPEVFSYSKGPGRRVVMGKDSAIARRYRERHPTHFH